MKCYDALLPIALLLLFQHQLVEPSPWSPFCPKECWCHETYLSSIIGDNWNPLNRTSMADGVDHSTSNGRVFRAAICVQQHDADIETLMERLPIETEAMKIIQAPDAKPTRFTTTHLNKFRSLGALSLEGRNCDEDTTLSSIVLRGDDRLTSQLEYLSLTRLEILIDVVWKKDHQIDTLTDLPLNPSSASKMRPHYDGSEGHFADRDGRLSYRIDIVTEEDNNVIPYEEYRQLADLKKDTLLFNRVQHLFIVDCRLPEWPLVSRSTSLKELVIRSSRMRVALAGVDLQQLQSLSMSDNQLLDLEAADLAGVGSLHTLDLSGNQLTRLTDRSFPQLADLEWLDLSSNPLEMIYPNAFANVSSVRRLVLSSHRWNDGDDDPSGSATISPVSLGFQVGSFNGMEKLRQLWLGPAHPVDGQGLNGDYFEDLIGLVELRLRGRIESVEADTFSAMRRLKVLDLKRCQLSRLSIDSFQALGQLRILILSSNQLDRLPSGIFDPVFSLKELWLDGNRLTSINAADLFAPLAATAKLVRLTDNPWHCTCQLSGLKATSVNKVSWLDAATNRTVYQYDRRVAPLCASPPRLKGASVFDAMRIPLRCSKAGRHRLPALPAAEDGRATESSWMQGLEEDHGPEATQDQEVADDSTPADRQTDRESADGEDFIDHGEEVIDEPTSVTEQSPPVKYKSHPNDVIEGRQFAGINNKPSASLLFLKSSTIESGKKLNSHLDLHGLSKKAIKLLSQQRDHRLGQ